MEKIMLKIELNSKYNSTIFETTGIIDKKNNILIYDDNERTKTSLNLERNFLMRENSIMKSNVQFNENKSSYLSIYLKEESQNLDINIFTKSIVKNDEFIEFIYLVNDVEQFTYKIQFIK